MGKISDKHGERFQQEVKEMENWYQGRIAKNMLANYCWFLQRKRDTMYKRQAER